MVFNVSARSVPVYTRVFLVSVESDVKQKRPQDGALGNSSKGRGATFLFHVNFPHPIVTTTVVVFIYTLRSDLSRTRIRSAGLSVDGGLAHMELTACRAKPRQFISSCSATADENPTFILLQYFKIKGLVCYSNVLQLYSVGTHGRPSGV